MIVCDTDVRIDALRGRRPGADRIAEELERGVLATTAVTDFELRSGARSASASESDMAARVRRRLEAAGASIGMTDYLIAGVCLSRSATLLTRNRAHFERVPGLALVSMERRDD